LRAELLAKQGLIIFLVGTKGRLPLYSISYLLDDFIEQYEQESRTLTSRDYDEVDRIRQNPDLLIKSYLFFQIEPFLLPFYLKK